MNLIGYARVSSDEQTLHLQQDALQAAGVARLHADEGVSGASSRRPGLDVALADLKSGDVLVVWKLDRLGRSLAHLIQLIAELGKRGVGFRSLTEGIDTTSPAGTLLFHIMGALAEFERSLLIERTRAGIVAARKRGQPIGRPKSMDGAQITHARQLLEQGKTQNEVASLMRVARSTLNRTLDRSKALHEKRIMARAAQLFDKARQQTPELAGFSFDDRFTKRQPGGATMVRIDDARRNRFIEAARAEIEN
jgi:DNA invertase Pin-like site-specific DNA recombinase